jgi:ribosome biogenesis GTPase / thiamine phosphate phosphatase
MVESARIVRLCGKKHWVWNGKEIASAFPAGRFELSSKGMKNRLAVGDFVKIRYGENEEQLIEELLERRNKFSRKMTFSGKEHVIAANLDEVAIVVTAFPKIVAGLIDRFYVASKVENIPISIVVNKIDLGSEEGSEEALRPFEEKGVKIFFTSTVKKTGIDAFFDHLKNKWVLLAGHSGVGKSSLVNALAPEAGLLVGSLDDDPRFSGKHTTASATANPLPNGGWIIDTAGIREFSLFNISFRDIEESFPEINSLSGSCKFPDCSHTHEPGCAVLKALEEETLDPERYQAYLVLLEEAVD